MTLDTLFSQLEHAQLIRRIAEGEATYIFNHNLTQEAVYQSLLKTQRRALHRAVAQAIEQVFPDQKSKLSDVLAYHWEQAEVPDRARSYLFRAAQNAIQRYAHQEALALLGRALDLSADAPREEVMAMRESRARIFEFLSQYAQATENYQAALALARQAQRAVDECRIMSRLAWLYWLDDKSAQAIEMAVQTETKARALQDASVALRAYLVQGLVAQAKGNLADAYPRMRRALFASRASDERALEGEALFYLGVENNFMGRFARAAACARRAYEIKKGLSDRVGEIVSLYLHARAEGGRANYDAALDALEAGHAVSQESRNPFGLAQYPNTRAWLCAELGDWQSAYALDRAGLDLARQAPVRPPEISTLINLVLDCAALDKFAEADAHMLELQKWIGRGEFGFHAWRWQMRFADAHARLLLKRSLCDEARHVVGGLLDWAGRTQSLKYRARGLLLRAQICIRTERRAAEADLVAARDCADVMCYLPARLEARQMLSALHPQQDQHRVEIAQLIADQDRRLKHPDLRRSFERGIARILSQ